MEIVDLKKITTETIVIDRRTRSVQQHFLIIICTKHNGIYGP